MRACVPRASTLYCTASLPEASAAISLINDTVHMRPSLSSTFGFHPSSVAARLPEI